jgi:hypothetical protein
MRGEDKLLFRISTLYKLIWATQLSNPITTPLWAIEYTVLTRMVKPIEKTAQNHRLLPVCQYAKLAQYRTRVLSGKQQRAIETAHQNVAVAPNLSTLSKVIHPLLSPPYSTRISGDEYNSQQTTCIMIPADYSSVLIKHSRKLGIRIRLISKAR